MYQLFLGVAVLRVRGSIFCFLLLHVIKLFFFFFFDSCWLEITAVKQVFSLLSIRCKD